MITDKEIQESKTAFKWLMVRWFLVSLTGFLSGVVIANFILKNYLGYKGRMATCNDTKDGDFAPYWFMPNHRRSLITTIGWWLRNHSWNFIRDYAPEWNAGQVDEFREIELTLAEIDMYDGSTYNRFTKASREEGIYGINHYAYRLNGKVFFNYSKATEEGEKQFGVGGNELRFLIKPISAVFKL